MLTIDCITIFPELLHNLAEHGVTGRALRTDIARLRTFNPRDDAGDARGTVDDRPFGGGPGMVMQYAPLHRCLERAVGVDEPRPPIIFLTPQGRRLTQSMCRRWAQRERLVLVCGRYEGIDQRFVDDCVDEEVSIGDYVLSGGELAAAVVIDALVRLLPGALGKDASALEDSFMDGVLDCPHYTRPERIGEEEVPSVLLSGDHAAVARWRRMQALGLTWRRRPDLLGRLELSETDRELLQCYIKQALS